MSKLGIANLRKVESALVVLLLMTVCVAAHAANAKTGYNVSGKIVDEAGNPIVGATVTLKDNKNVSTITDVEGNYSLNVDKNHKKAELDVKYIGYDTKNITPKKDKDSRIDTLAMKENAYSLNDVVVIGYGKSSREKLIGSVAKVKGESVVNTTQDSPILALQGNAAGVFVQQGSGVPGAANSTIVIRGYNTLSTSRYYTMPLYIVDGVTIAHTEENPVSYIKEGVFETPDPLAFINPNDIESIEVLKDADATAIYGTRGANGVIIITTKKGKQGKVKVNFSADATASWMSKRLDFCSTEEYLALRKEAFASDLANGYVKESDWNADNFPDIFLWDQNADYDWQGTIMGGTAWAKNVQLNVSGGNKNTTFMVSGAYYKASTVTNADDTYTRWTGSANIQHHSDNNRFRIEAGINITNLIEQANAAICSFAYMNTVPNCPPYDEYGNPYYIEGDPDYTSPLAGRGYTGKNDVTSLMANATASYKLWDELTAKVKVGYAFSGSSQNNNYDSYYQNPYKDTSYNYGDYAMLDVKTISIEPQLTYAFNGLGGRFNFLLGGTYEYSNTKAMALYEKDYLGDMFLKNAAAANIVTTRSNPETQTKTASYFGRVSYDYQGRYLANAVLRRDGSSHFGKDHRWGTFYSVGGAWIFTKENFLKDNESMKFLSFGKLRMSYGKTGNDNVGNYEYISSYAVSKYPYNGTIGICPDNVGDENLHWETVKKFDVGLELGFLNDRIMFNANYYCNTSSDLLKSSKVASQVGYSSVTTNIDAEIRNTGWELELNSRVLDGKKWKWNMNLNMTFPKNKLIKYANLESSSYYNTYFIGQSINVIRGYKYLGIDNQTGIPQFEDVNGDGKLNSSDYQLLGDLDPDMYGGFSNKINYKNLTLDVSFYFRVKPVQRGFYYSYDYPAGYMRNVLKDYAENHWTTPGQDAKYPGITTSTSSPLYTAMTSYWGMSDVCLSTGSYIKLSNVKLTYSLPKSLMKKMKIDDISFYVQAKNLFTITGYDSYSPETANGYVPPSTSVTFGVNIGL